MVLGIGCALVDVGVLSSMGTLVDTRHAPVYGTVFAVSLNETQRQFLKLKSYFRYRIWHCVSLLHWVH